MKIGYKNVLTETTVSSSSEGIGFEKENAYNSRTGDYWKPLSSPAWLKAAGSMPLGMWLAYTTEGPFVSGISDLTPHNKSLSLIGVINRTKHSSNTGIVECGGFSAANYFEQQYNAAFEFGTGDFSACGWVRSAKTAFNKTIFSRGNSPGELFTMRILANGYLSYSTQNTGITYTGTEIDDNKIHFVCMARRSGITYLYLDGALVGSAPDLSDQTTTGGQTLRFGNDHQNSSPLVNGFLVSWSIEGIGKTSRQIKARYDVEKHFFISGGTLPVKFLSTRATSADYFALYDHDFSLTGSSIVLQYSDDDASWINAFEPIYPASSSPVFKPFIQSSHAFWRVYIDGNIQNIGVCMFGLRLDFKQGLTFGFAPPSMAQQFMPRTNISAEGEFIGHRVTKKPIPGNLVFNPVFTQAWVRQFWPDLIRHMEKMPFVVLPEDPYPNEALFCWADRIQGPEYSTTFMSVRIPIKAKVS